MNQKPMAFEVFYRKRDKSRDAYFVTAETIIPSDYEKVASVEAADLEDLFRRLNLVDGSEIEYVGRGKLEIRSLSVGDVAVTSEGAFLCAGCGWEKISEGKFQV